MPSRDSCLRLAGQPALRDRVRDALGEQATGDASYLPRLLWEPAPRPLCLAGFAALAGALVALCAAAMVW